MKEIDFFDMNVTLGRPAVPKLRTEVDPSVMRADLAAVRVSGGLVKHTLSLEWHPTEGNAEISRLLAGQLPYEPVWALMPHWTGEFPSPDAVASAMARDHVRAAVMYPVRHGYPMRRTVVGPLLEVLAASRVPLLLPFADADLGVVESVARDFPSLPVVVCEAAYSVMREFYAIFGACPNVFLETSGFMVHRGVEDVVSRFGPGRLLFGTRYPTFVPGCAVAGVMYAAIPDDAKRAIAGGNALALLSQVKLQ